MKGHPGFEFRMDKAGGGGRGRGLLTHGAAGTPWSTARQQPILSPANRQTAKGMTSSTNQLFDMQIGPQASSKTEHFSGSRCREEVSGLPSFQKLGRFTLSLWPLTISEALLSSFFI